VAEGVVCTQPEGSFNPGTGQFEPGPRAAGVPAPAFPRALLGEGGTSYLSAGKTLHEDEAIRLWTLDDEVLIASIKSKMHAISPAVAEGLSHAVDLAEAQFQGIVVWSGDEPFSVGADLQAMLPGFMMGGVAVIDGAEAELQNVMLKLRYAQVPTIAAVRGMALGGGCELAVHCARRVVHMESYMGWWR
jgi:3-hydroxyacyl-CoA dehydrogenase